MTTTRTKIEVIESRTETGAYGFSYTHAIIDHPVHGRVYLREGWGGDSLEGQCYRWKHGTAYQVAATETLDSISEQKELMFYGGIPALEWTGRKVATVAKQARL